MMSVATRHLVPSFAWEKEQEGGEAEMRGERVETGTRSRNPVWCRNGPLQMVADV